jgi:hypothetical protein
MKISHTESGIIQLSEPKQGWMTHVEFNDNRFVFNIQLDVQMEDGTITRVVELNRNALKK